MVVLLRIVFLFAIAARGTHGFSSPRNQHARVGAWLAKSVTNKHTATKKTTRTTRSLAMSSNPNDSIDPNRYNIELDDAAKLWKASVQEKNSNIRDAGIPYLDSNSKNYFVDDLENIQVSRDGGLGLELLELAGGREDGFGITIVTAVTKGGNAERAGIIPGDSIAAVTVSTTNVSGNSIEETNRVRGCECLDFDSTIDVLGNFPGDAEEILLSIKRLRRWPKVNVTVKYPPSQCAEGVSNVKNIELFAGENLRRAMLNRGIIMDDPEAGKCDYCGTKCVVSITRGVRLLNPVGTTEKKIMERNPSCRLSCKTTVGHNMQEGDMELRVNLMQWKEK